MLDPGKIRMISERMRFNYNSVDFFYAFAKAKGIENPEEELTDKEYDKLEREFDETLSYETLKKILYKLKCSVQLHMDIELDETMRQIVKGE